LKNETLPFQRWFYHTFISTVIKVVYCDSLFKGAKIGLAFG
jgi:hypothetical protein